MTSRHCRLCSLAVFPAVCAALFTASTLHSSVIHGTHLRKKTHVKRSEEEGYGGYPAGKFHDRTTYGSHVWHHSPPSYEHSPKFTGTGVRDPNMVSAGKKENEQREGGPIHPGVIPLVSQPDGQETRTAAGSLDSVLASATMSASSAGEMPPTSSAGSSSPSANGGQASHSSSSASALATTSVSSAASSSSFQPALLAFILVPVCIFLLGMMFALYRIYGRPGNRLPPASPLFLGETTPRGSGYHRDEAISVNEPAMQPTESPLTFDLHKNGTIKWEPFVDRSLLRTGPVIANASTPKTAYASHFLKPPVPTHVARGGRYNSPSSRVLRPYAPRSYHRPHSTNTADPESVIPLIDNSKINISQGRCANHNPKGNNKENIPHPKGDHARRHRDAMSTTPLNTSPRSLSFRDPVISAVISDMDICFQAKTRPSSSSVVSVANDGKQLAAPPLPSTDTSFDIGLAMMSDFSSPNVGLGLDLSPRLPPLNRMSTVATLQEADSLKNGSLGDLSREAALPYLEHSVTAGSKGLADLSRYSREMTPPIDNQGEQIEDELDIALALAVYKTHHAGDRLQVHKDPVDQKSEPQSTGTDGTQGSSVSFESLCETRYTPTSVKAPTLPTLSEMALSRADPLYESVTNELFSSYGMRMSTANGQRRSSRVSARISKMLSWFTDPSASSNRNSIMENRMSCEDSIFSGAGYRERRSDMQTPGVQPLRIGKVRKNAV